MQQLTEEAYRDFKRSVVTNAIRQAGFDAPAEVIFLPAGTRRRVELKIAHTPKGIAFAYYAPRSNDLVAVDDCLILTPKLQALLKPLAGALADWPGISAIHAITLTAADSGIDLVLQQRSSPIRGEAGRGARSDSNVSIRPHPNPPPIGEGTLSLPGIARVSLQQNDDAPKVIAEHAPITMQLGGYDIPIPPNVFLQAASEAQHLITDWVKEAAVGAQCIADLFCGIGTYSFPLSKTAKVHGVESDGGMIKNLAAQAQKLGIALSGEKRDLFKNPLSAKELERFEAVVINPPRPGAKAQCEELAKSTVKKVIMVSCSPASFARDAKILKNAGFTLHSAKAIDQFVYSPHLEIVAVFKR